VVTEPDGPGAHWDAIVLAGASSRRLGGADKPALLVGGMSLLERQVLAARRGGARRVVVVGPRRAQLRDVACEWVEESPPGSGPAAALATGVRALDESLPVVVLAADQPVGPELLELLLAGFLRAAASGADGVIARVEGRDQNLLLCALRPTMQRACDGVELVDAPMRRILDRMALTPVEVRGAHDADTWQAVTELRESLGDGGAMDATRDWVAEAARIADVPGTVDLDAILGLARDAAHGVERPAAPVSTYLLGYAAAARGLSGEEVAALAAALGRAALGSQEEEQ